MQTALRVTTRVLPGHWIEITVPELPIGTEIEVLIVIAEASQPYVPETGSAPPSAEE